VRGGEAERARERERERETERETERERERETINQCVYIIVVDQRKRVLDDYQIVCVRMR
jgi:hypothetical protein